jgi:hypothetical protein
MTGAIMADKTKPVSIRLAPAEIEQLQARAVFLYGFAKNERDNIDNDELATLRDIAAVWLVADAAEIERAITEGVLQELEP